jgi:hypothetical protein
MACGRHPARQSGPAEPSSHREAGAGPHQGGHVDTPRDGRRPDGARALSSFIGLAFDIGAMSLPTVSRRSRKVEDAATTRDRSPLEGNIPRSPRTDPERRRDSGAARRLSRPIPTAIRITDRHRTRPPLHGDAFTRGRDQISVAQVVCHPVRDSLRTAMARCLTSAAIRPKGGGATDRIPEPGGSGSVAYSPCGSGSSSSETELMQ